MMNKQRIMSCMLTVTVVAGNIAVCAQPVCAKEIDNDGKEEIVYVMTTADGEVENVNVVNIFGKGEVEDYGDYSNVKILNTTDPIHQDGDKITFTSDAEKVYYQGTLNNARIPWNISIQYYLDGKETSAEDVAGATGSLEIKICIEENKNADTDFYEQYALQAAVTLDTEKCSNIRADGATIANVGSKKQLSYTVLPDKGLETSIYADVKDFEMDAVAINGVKLNLNLELDDSELLDQVDEITDATKKLDDGAGELADGTDELKGGGKTLADGTSSLQSGASSLSNGISSLSNGVNDMQSALNTLNTQSGTLTDGSGKIRKALTEVKTQLDQVSMSTDQLKTLTDSSAAIKQGIGDLYNGAASLQGAVSYDSYKASMQAAGMNVDDLQAQNAAVAGSLGSQIAGLNASIDQLKAAPDYSSNTAYQSQVAQMEEQVSSLTQVVTLLNGNNAALSGVQQYLAATSQGAGDLTANIGSLQTNYKQFDTSITALVASLSDLVVNMNKLKNGIDQLVVSYGQLDDGINQYTGGIAAIAAAYGQLVDGTNKLVAGSGELAKGSSDLNQGMFELYDGILALSDGADKLKDGTSEFAKQTDGMDDKISDTIDDTISSMTGGDAPVVSFVSDKNTDVKTVQFVIKTAAIEIPETEAVVETKQETGSFWQKLTGLFHK